MLKCGEIHVDYICNNHIIYVYICIKHSMDYSIIIFHHISLVSPMIAQQDSINIHMLNIQEITNEVCVQHTDASIIKINRN